MKYVLTPEEMYKCEKESFLKGLSPKKAMYDAGSAVYEKVKNENKVLIVCGCGNNGGDGFVCAYRFKLDGRKADVFVWGDKNKMSEHTRFYFELVKENTVNELKDEYDCIVDALYGIGFKGSVREEDKKILSLINSLAAKKVSVDVPSGLNGKDGKGEECVKADETVTFGGIKYGHIIGNGGDKCGKITVADIGIGVKSNLIFAEEEDIKEIIPKVSNIRHKGTRGFAGIIAGSFGMEGAGQLSAISSLRSNAGKTALFVSEECKGFYFGRNAEVMLATYKSPNEAEIFIKDKDIIVFGPGIGRDEKQNTALLDILLCSSGCPLIIDADGLYFLTKEKIKKSKRKIILTPHMGEATRLFGVNLNDLTENPAKYASEFYGETGATVLLKSNYNVIAGEKTYITSFGCPAMATAGSGDVLSGILAGAYLTVKDIEKACLLASFIHGTAGKKAQEEKSAFSVTAGDISENIFYGFKKLTE